MRTKSEFRLLREELGFTVETLARILDVTPMTVYRWESSKPSHKRYKPSDKAWEIIEQQAATRRKIVNIALSKAAESKDSVKITYWRDQDEYRKANPSGRGDYMQANATARAIYDILSRKGFKVDVLAANMA